MISIKIFIQYIYRVALCNDWALNNKTILSSNSILKGSLFNPLYFFISSQLLNVLIGIGSGSQLCFSALYYRDTHVY